MFIHERNSNATMVDSDGLLKWAPHNLLTYSEDLTVVRGWAAIQTGDGVLPVATNTSDINPDGVAGVTKLTLDRSTANTLNYSLYRKDITLNADTTASIWIKAFSAGDVGKIVDVYHNAGNLFLTLVNVTLTDSWQKVSVPRGGVNAAQFFTLGLYSTSASAEEVNMLIWGAHIYRSDLGGMVNNPDQPAVLATYVPTTSSAVYLPRRNHYGWNGSSYVNKGLLLETEARTNLLQYSEDFSSWSFARTTIGGSTTSPTGNSDAVELIETNTTGTHIRYIAVSGTTSTTLSVYAKASTRTAISIGCNSGVSSNWAAAAYDLSSGTAATAQYGGDFSAQSFIESVGGGWYRCILQVTSVAATIAQMKIGPLDTATPTFSSWADYSYSGNETSGVYVYGAQLEAGSTTSSYIPNYGDPAGEDRALETLTIPAAKMAWPTPNVIGPELVTNGTFDVDEADTTGWDTSTAFSATGSSVDGSFQISTSSSNGRQISPITFEAGKIYQITADCRKVSGSGSAFVGIASTTTGSTFIPFSSTTSPTFETLTSVFVPPSTSMYVSAGFTLNGTGVAEFDNISVKEIDPLSVSLQMQGEMTYADNNSLPETELVRWLKDGSNYIREYITTSSTLTGRMDFLQEYNNATDGVTTSDTYFSPGVNVPYNIASRHGPTFINGAVDGTALTADTTPTALPDLSATNFNLGYDYMGTIALFRQDKNDWEDTGITTATSKPVNIIYPIVTGLPYIGETLTTTDGLWSGSPTITYQWLRDGEDIAGATNNSYTLVSADDGTNISCRVTATINTVNTPVITNSIGLIETVPALAIRDRNSEPILDRNNNFIEERA